MIEPTFCNFFFYVWSLEMKHMLIIWKYFSAWVYQKLGHLFSFVSELVSFLHDIWHFGKLTIEDNPLLEIAFHWEAGKMPGNESEPTKSRSTEVS